MCGWMIFPFIPYLLCFLFLSIILVEKPKKPRESVYGRGTFGESQKEEDNGDNVRFGKSCWKRQNYK
jgi:hypothetical protein